MAAREFLLITIVRPQIYRSFATSQLFRETDRAIPPGDDGFRRHPVPVKNIDITLQEWGLYANEALDKTSAISSLISITALADHGGNKNKGDNNNGNGSFESSVVGSVPSTTISGVASGGAP